MPKKKNDQYLPMGVHWTVGGNYIKKSQTNYINNKILNIILELYSKNKFV